MPHRTGFHRVAAAFAQERDAHYAVRLCAGALAHAVEYKLRPVIGESGYVQLVVLEASFEDPSLAERVLNLMRGAHGVPIPIDPVETAHAAI